MGETKSTTHTFSSLYERILFSIPDIIFIFNSEGKFTEFYNEQGSLLYLQPEDFIGRDILDTNLPENIKKTTKRVVEKILEDKQDRRFHYQLDISGESRHFEARFFYLENDRVFTIIRDITNIKKAEIVQKQLKKYYQNILDRLDIGVLETDINGKIYYANNVFQIISGKLKSEITGMNFFTLFNFSKEKEKLKKEIKKNSEKDIFITFEANHLGDIRDRSYKISIVVSNDSGNQNQASCNINVSDVTEIKKKEELVHKSESTYKNLVESSPNGILIQDDNRILYLNPAALQILGFRDEKHAFQSRFKDILIEESIPIFIEAFLDIKKGKVVSYNEVKVKRPTDNRIIELEVIPARIYFEGREVYQIVVKDVSLQKNLLETKIRADIAEESYRKLRKEVAVRQEIEQKLSRSLEEKSILLKEVHHRVKNNLQIISSILNLEIRSQSEKNVMQALRRIQNRIYSIYLIHEIVYQTDMFSRIDLGRYIRLISENMMRNTMHEKLRFEYNFEPVYVSLEIGVPIGMIINELFSNYFELHTDFNDEKPLKISLKQVNMQNQLCIEYPVIQLSKRAVSVVESSLSSQLIEALVDQINGNYNINTENEKNINFLLLF